MWSLPGRSLPGAGGYNRRVNSSTPSPSSPATAFRLLLSNDDGYFAPGLAQLADGLAGLGEITVVAPERDRSGASNSLTLDRPLSVRTAASGFQFVNGTPTDCVHLAVTGLLPVLPHMVVSGINHGSNMGDDTIYSGTVAAATEGFLLGLPAMAFSLAGKEGRHFATAAAIARQLVERALRYPLPAATLLNVNVPDIPLADMQGIEVTRLGKRHKAEGVIRASNPRGQTVYWIGAAGEAQDAGPGTDFHAVAAGRVSITPLQIDLTHAPQMGAMRDWLAA